jgi:murein DD-endopeptidase MepM/ murein hydrolase activator NlpD
MKLRHHILTVLVVLAASAGWFGVVNADDSVEVRVEDETIASQITDLNSQITDKRDDITRLNRNIEEYKKKIETAHAKSASLANEIELLENRMAKTELDIEATTMEVEAVNAEIEVLEKQIMAIESQLNRDREALADLLRKMDVYDNDMTLQLLFGSDSFGELFDRLQELASVTGDLEKALQQAEAQRLRVEQDRTAELGKREQLSALQDKLETQRDLLEREKQAKETLLAESERTEATFQMFLYELREEQQFINQQIATLQGKIEAKLNAIDSGGQGSSVLSWPVDPYKGLTTTFHDPTYPFRHLFEHSGIDIPTPQGTPVGSAAPGYVAWTRTGRLYGNYVMVVHTNGVATLYAHLSKISVAQDQFVARGSVIGLSGGMPGTAGAGLSTGPHLHFEVRENGIPVNPLGYLVE